MQTIIDRVIEDFRRQSFIEQANKAYWALRENREAWDRENSRNGGNGKPPWPITRRIRSMGEPLRGDIWLVDLNPTVDNLFVSRHLAPYAALSGH